MTSPFIIEKFEPIFECYHYMSYSYIRCTQKNFHIFLIPLCTQIKRKQVLRGRRVHGELYVIQKKRTNRRIDKNVYCHMQSNLIRESREYWQIPPLKYLCSSHILSPAPITWLLKFLTFASVTSLRSLLSVHWFVHRVGLLVGLS